jgi:hypothetical protein
MVPGRTPLGKRTAEQLFANAAELDAMALTATTPEVKRSLETLAVRYRTLAEQRLAEQMGRAAEDD